MDKNPLIIDNVPGMKVNRSRSSTSDLSKSYTEVRLARISFQDSWDLVPEVGQIGLGKLVNGPLGKDMVVFELCRTQHVVESDPIWLVLGICLDKVVEIANTIRVSGHAEGLEDIVVEPGLESTSCFQSLVEGAVWNNGVGSCDLIAEFYGFLEVRLFKQSLQHNVVNLDVRLEDGVLGSSLGGEHVEQRVRLFDVIIFGQGSKKRVFQSLELRLRHVALMGLVEVQTLVELFAAQVSVDHDIVSCAVWLDALSEQLVNALDSQKLLWSVRAHMGVEKLVPRVDLRLGARLDQLSPKSQRLLVLGRDVVDFHEHGVRFLGELDLALLLGHKNSFEQRLHGVCRNPEDCRMVNSLLNNRESGTEALSLFKAWSLLNNKCPRPRTAEYMSLSIPETASSRPANKSEIETVVSLVKTLKEDIGLRPLAFASA
ncbi:hypothetical protein OGAPHI_007332 [Ogataea philodendri]|uniref:Uncharacterized protein n=1 Tax=Ogataea philodendri TaxID=1378263 RepID=A0A9P8NVH1_9ASCO|nr:uncharacterized protein OGAPHI_007332 [Ogataea philodendri]KAH3660127.1 hypothetical protein OGAPHI_007332 [Ogataea philodendri]